MTSNSAPTSSAEDIHVLEPLDQGAGSRSGKGRARASAAPREMRLLSPKDLGRWEADFRSLVEGARLPLTPKGTWLLADKPAIVAIFDEDEVVYVTATRSLAKTMQSFHKEGAVNELRSYVAIFECGLSPKTAEKRYTTGRAAQRVDTAIAKLTFAAIPGSPALLDQVAKAFIAVADPRYNGPTATSNLAIDALPQ